jgi:hypothetical protein
MRHLLEGFAQLSLSLRRMQRYLDQASVTARDVYGAWFSTELMHGF